MAQVKTELKSQAEHRKKIISLTKNWIGTPYHHQQSLKQKGCDCLGLVRGIYEELYQIPTNPITPYSKDWADVTKKETLINAAKDHLIASSVSTMKPGDVLIFRFKKWMVAKHTGILVSPTTMVHAIEGAPISEVHLGNWWRRRIAAVFSFPLTKTI